ncbi:hypothetical protein F5Y18DRAFT_379405 [Xylariaceae sp. FL1019]|nr:hypothetical protein F5Y18DRAFT_379405 [Xylariaceae sp. FL1019]
MNIVQHHDVSAHLGAGDLASLLLDAGVVSMGFKMFEYRSELFASLGTVTLTCIAVASSNVFLNVLIAHSFGLQAPEAISFAAKSTTIALGVPAVELLGGRTTLMSTLAIFSSILFQIMGDWLFSTLRINDRRPHLTSGSLNKSMLGDRTTLFSTNSTVHCTENSDPANRWPSFSGHKRSSSQCKDEGAIVAAGVTVGINAAALGVAFCIERKSRATAYCALSMIMFGAATVALSAIPGVAKTVMVSLTSL